MKQKLFFLFVIVILISCEDKTIIDKLLDCDKTLAKVIDYSFINNDTFTVKYSETVEIIDAEIDKRKIKDLGIGSLFSITLDQKIKRGEKKTLSITAKKQNGNTTRSSFLLIGRNNEIPKALINEVSIKGNNTNPDRIELLLLDDGNTASMVVTNGFSSLKGHDYILPDLDVKKGDIIVIYWDSIAKREDEERDNGKMTYYLMAKSPKTLLSTDGIVVLKSEADGYVMDALVYSDNNLDEYSGYGSENLEIAVEKLIDDQAWEGSAVDSSLVTSSRVLARLPDGVDTNSKADWFTTKARMSTFGYENIYEPYEGE